VQRPADYIVAVVNSEPITNHQVRQEAQRLGRQLAQSQQAVPANTELAARALERLINERAQLQQARETGIRIDDASVDEAELNVARQNQIDVAEMHKRLAAGRHRSQPVPQAVARPAHAGARARTRRQPEGAGVRTRDRPIPARPAEAAGRPGQPN
jgi:2-hydroxychromene-2-carboxylate isomerase